VFEAMKRMKNRSDSFFMKVTPERTAWLDPYESVGFVSGHRFSYAENGAVQKPLQG
jgi:hypothetical protein